MRKKDYNEYRVVLTNLPGGPDNPAEFVELENEHGQSIDVGEWVEIEDGLVALVLPVYKVIDPEQDEDWKETMDFHRDDR